MHIANTWVCVGFGYNCTILLRFHCLCTSNVLRKNTNNKCTNVPVVVVYRVTIIANGHGQLKKSRLMITGCVLRTALTSWNNAHLLNIRNSSWFNIWKYSYFAIVQVIILNCGHVCVCADCGSELIRLSQPCPGISIF